MFPLCLCVSALHSVFRDVNDCIRFLFCVLFYYAVIFVCPFLQVYSATRLSSRHCVRRMNHLPHESEELREAFWYSVASRLHNAILTALCTHLCTHKLGYRWREAPHMHTPYSHCLVLLTQTQSEHVHTIYTYAHWGPPPTSLSFSTVDSLLDHQGPEAETEWQRKRSVDQFMCVLCTPQPPVLPLPFPQFQSANSAVRHLDLQPCKHCFHHHLPHSQSNTGFAFKHMVVTCKMTHSNSFWWARNWKLWDTLKEASPSLLSDVLACWIIHLFKLQDYTGWF